MRGQYLEALLLVPLTNPCRGGNFSKIVSRATRNLGSVHALHALPSPLQFSFEMVVGEGLHGNLHILLFPSAESILWVKIKHVFKCNGETREDFYLE